MGRRGAETGPAWRRKGERRTSSDSHGPQLPLTGLQPGLGSGGRDRPPGRQPAGTCPAAALRSRPSLLKAFRGPDRQPGSPRLPRPCPGPAQGRLGPAGAPGGRPGRSVPGTASEATVHPPPCAATCRRLLESPRGVHGAAPRFLFPPFVFSGALAPLRPAGASFAART